MPNLPPLKSLCSVWHHPVAAGNLLIVLWNTQLITSLESQEDTTDSVQHVNEEDKVFLPVFRSRSERYARRSSHSLIEPMRPPCC